MGPHKKEDHYQMDYYDEAQIEGHYEDEANNTSLIMDKIVKSQQELVGCQKEIGNQIDRWISHMHKLFIDRINKESKDSEERWSREIKIRNEDKNEVTMASNSNVDYDETPEKISLLTSINFMFITK